MKVAINVLSILGLGIVLGLIIRNAKSPPKSSVPDGVVVYTDDPSALSEDGTPIAESHGSSENPDPVKPPEDEPWLSRFELTERNGETVSSESLIGHPYLVSFFFTTCPSICVQQNQKLKELQDQFAGRDIKFLAITVDPETDTLDRLKEYATRFGADPQQWLFLTGDLTYIRRIGAEIFQQPVDKKFHTERFALVDPEGNIEGIYSWPEKRQMEKMVEEIESMLNSSISKTAQTKNTEKES